MKILLTGGAGFIGSHLLERLLERGDDVAVIDDFNDYYDPRIKRANLPKGGFRLHERDLRDAAPIVAQEKPDLLVHLAARAGVRPSQLDPALYESVNVAGTLGLLEACRKAGAPPLRLPPEPSRLRDPPRPLPREQPRPPPHLFLRPDQAPGRPLRPDLPPPARDPRHQPPLLHGLRPAPA